MTSTIIKKEDTKRAARVAIMCCDDPHHFYLIQQLQQNFQVVGVVMEPNKNQMNWLWKKKRYKLWMYRKYHSKRRRWMGHSAHRKQFFEMDFDLQKITIPVQNVYNINDRATATFLNEIKPDITIVCGTMFVGKRAREAGQTIINLHGGVLPEYKGNQCIFFALYEKNYEKVGATIHLVTEELDGGAIIEIVQPEIMQGDNDETLYAKSLKLCVDQLKKLLHEYENGKDIIAVSQPLSNKKTFSHKDRTPWVELKYYWSRLLN